MMPPTAIDVSPTILFAIFTVVMLPRYATSSENVLPLVDLNGVESARSLVDALQSWGFSYITGHDVPHKVIKRADKFNKRFFSLPQAEKEALQADRYSNPVLKTTRGYTGVGDEQLNGEPFGRPDLKEVLDVGFVSNANLTHHLGTNKWPSPPLSSTPRTLRRKGRETRIMGLQNSIETYAAHSANVAKKVLKLLAEGLGEEGAFDTAFGDDALQVQRLTKYPRYSQLKQKEPGQIGAGVHSDFGGVTILHADGSGLSVLRPNISSPNLSKGTFSPELQVPHSGQWVSVEPKPGALIVMGGEALQRLSNGLIYAAKHKVDNQGDRDRYSLAFFYDPRPDAVLEPLEQFRRGGRSSLYKGKLAGHKGVIKKLFNIQCPDIFG